MAVWRLQVNTGGANVADCLQNHVAALGGWQGTCYGAFTKVKRNIYNNRNKIFLLRGQHFSPPPSHYQAVSRLSPVENIR